MESKIRDLREKYFQIDDEYLNGYAKLCGINATGVYISMCRHANKQQQCFPSKKLLSEELSISERSIYSAIKKLQEWNIIKVEEQGRKKDGSFKVKLYTLLDKKYWKKRTVGKSCRRQEVQAPQANNDKSPQATVAQEGNTVINQTHITKHKVFSYEKTADTYKSKYKIANHKGIKLKRTPRSIKQEQTTVALKMLTYYRDKAQEIHGMQFFKVQDESRNKAVRKLIIRAAKECNLKDLIDWWIDGAGEWAGYEPENCFSTRIIERFKNKGKAKSKIINYDE